MFEGPSGGPTYWIRVPKLKLKITQWKNLENEVNNKSGVSVGTTDNIDATDGSVGQTFSEQTLDWG